MKKCIQIDEVAMKISDLLQTIVDNRGKTPPISDAGHCLLEINCIATKGKYPEYSLIKKHVTEETYTSWFRSGHPKKGDILIPTVGTLDAISMMDRNDCCIAQNVVAFRTNPSVCDNEFLYYLLCDPSVRRRLLQLNIGAVQPSIKVPHLKNLEVNIPAISIQRKIAQVLCNIDEKIRQNKRINENLFQQLFALYDYYYDSADDGEVELGALCQFQEGYVNPAQTRPEYFDGDVKWLRAVDINESFIIETSRTLTQAGFQSAKKSAYLFPPNTIVISKSGTIGRLGIVADYMCGNRAVKLHLQTDLDKVYEHLAEDETLMQERIGN